MSRPRLSHDTRRRLLDHGLAALIQRGYHATGLKEVLDDVDVPKGSFYNYFKSKEEFGAEVIRHYGEQLRARAAQVLCQAGGGNALDALRRFLRLEIEANRQTRYGCLIGNLGAELGATCPSCRIAMVEAVGTLRDLYAQTLARAQRQGTVRTDRSAAELADFLVNAWEGALLRMKVEQSVEPLRQVESLVLGDFFSPGHD